MLMFVAGIVFLCLLGWALSLYTKNNTTVIIPDLKGHQVAQLALELKNTDLDFVVIDSIFREDSRGGEIVDQIPAAGKKVKKGRKVLLTINAYDRPKVKMPKLVDHSLRNAQVVLNVAGLRLGKVLYKPSEYNDLVLEQKYDGQQIAEGTLLAKGACIDLIVGRGNQSKQVVVPSCVGMPLHEAILTLNAASLRKGNLYYDDNVSNAEDSLSAVVYQQNPAADGTQQMPLGSSIHLWLTSNMQKVIDAQISEEEE